MMTQATNAICHPWEKAGLGKAPFRWMGVSEERGPRLIGKSPDGIATWTGAPGQPMGVCAYCGQGIAECHHIRSADGREFTVGCNCVSKVEDRGSPVLTAAQDAARKLRNAKARKRNAAKAEASKAELAELLARPEVREELSSRPSSIAWRAEQGDTELDQIEWRARACGHSGRVRLIAQLKERFAAGQVKP